MAPTKRAMDRLEKPPVFGDSSSNALALGGRPGEKAPALAGAGSFPARINSFDTVKRALHLGQGMSIPIGKVLCILKELRQ